MASTAPDTPVEPAKPAEQCEAADGEIVVCGSRKANDRYRLKPLPPVKDTPKNMEVSLAEGVTLSAGINPGAVPGAENVPSFMVRLKIKF